MEIGSKITVTQTGDDVTVLLGRDADGADFVVALEVALRTCNAAQSLVVKRIEYPDMHKEDGCGFFSMHFRIV